MLNWNGKTLILWTALTVTSAATLVGCGGGNYPAETDSASRPGAESPIVHSPDNGGNGNPSTSPATDGKVTDKNPTFIFPVRAVGYSSYVVKVRARSILRVQFTPGVQDTVVRNPAASPTPKASASPSPAPTFSSSSTTPSASPTPSATSPGTKTGFAPQYAMLGVYIAVNGTEQATPLLHNGLITGEAESSAIIDFSSTLDGQEKEYQIYVRKPNYDYWCYSFGQYCPYTHVYETHPWNGTLEVQTDETNSL